MIHQNTVVGVRGSNFDEQYNLLQFHLHWGFNDFQGSEHLIDGEKFPLEVTIFYFNKAQIISNSKIL